MAQATATLPPAPAGYGTAFCEVLETVRSLTADQVRVLNNASEHLRSNAAHQKAVQRFEAAFEMIEGAVAQIAAEGKLFITAPGGALDALYAVLLRDRGLITAADFTTITDPWTTAGLPLPTVITGDDEVDGLAPVDQMTSDRIADELRQAATGQPAIYGAVLMLTGYNDGELLAYPGIRRFIVRDDDGALKVDWDGLDDSDDAFEELNGDATSFLTTTIEMASLTVERPEENAEVFVQGMAYVYGVQDLLDPRWETRDDEQAGDPAATSAPPAGGSDA